MSIFKDLIPALAAYLKNTNKLEKDDKAVSRFLPHSDFGKTVRKSVYTTCYECGMETVILLEDGDHICMYCHTRWRGIPNRSTITCACGTEMESPLPCIWCGALVCCIPGCGELMYIQGYDTCLCIWCARVFRENFADHDQSDGGAPDNACTADVEGASTERVQLASE